MTRQIAMLSVAWLLFGCGYQLGYAPRDPDAPFVVRSAAVRVADVGVVGAAVMGARAEVARAFELGERETASVIEVEILRVEETSEGIAVGRDASPFARAVRITVTGRAVLRSRAGAHRESSVLQASEVVRTASDPVGGLTTRDEVGRIAARRLGEMLVRQLLGLPDVPELR